MQTVAQVRQTGEGLKRGGKRFGEAAWGPLARLSGALWLEVTGLFFGIFAVFAAQGAWKMRGEWHSTASNHDAHMHLLASAAMAVVFGYFCVSSFVRGEPPHQTTLSFLARVHYSGMAESKKNSSEVPVRPVYRAADFEGFDAATQLGEPGEYPFTRGIQPTMYRGRLWTMRQYAGHGRCRRVEPAI